MEEQIVESMKSNEDITKYFSNGELDEFLNILTSNDSDVKRQERFAGLIKGVEQ